jgi:hypothetical protein
MSVRLERNISLLGQGSSYMILFTSDLPLLAFNGAIKVLIRVHNINVIINCSLIACYSYTSIRRSRTCLVVS